MLHTAPSYAQPHTLGQTHVLLRFLVFDTTDCGVWLVFLIHLLQVSVRNSCWNHFLVCIPHKDLQKTARTKGRDKWGVCACVFVWVCACVVCVWRGKAEKKSEKWFRNVSVLSVQATVQKLCFYCGTKTFEHSEMCLCCSYQRAFHLHKANY